MSKDKNTYFSVKGMVLMLLLAMEGVRWFTFGAKNGPSCVLLWIAAALILFIPMALIVAEFGTAFPEKEGGLTDWVREIMGDKIGFLASWYYFFSVLCYIPAVLIFAGILFAYMINPELAKNTKFIAWFVVIAFWIMILIFARSTEIFQKTSSLAGLLGTVLPIIVLVSSAIFIVAFLNYPIATDFSPKEFIPNLKGEDFSLLIAMAMGLVGIELAGPFVSKMKNPQKEFSKVILYATIGIILAYILGSLSLLLIKSPDEFNTANGLLEVILAIMDTANMHWVATILFFLLFIGNMGISVVWLVGATKMTIDGNDPKIFPEFLLRKTKKGVHMNALVVQGVIISLIMIVNSTLPSVEALYNLLVLMISVFMFIAYFLMAYSYIKMKLDNSGKYKSTFEIPGGIVSSLIIFILPAAVCIISTVYIIAQPIGNPYIYEFQVLGGPVIFGIIGLHLYKRKEKHDIRIKNEQLKINND
jgi:glutamate:GABA antiporter